MTYIEKQPCSIDLYNSQEVIQHFRDLISMGHMLDIDMDTEMSNFRKKLREFGYDVDIIHHLTQLACFGTIYEAELPHPIRNRGDYWEWMRLKPRSKQR